MIAKKEIEKMPVLPAKAKGNDRFIGRIRMAGEVLVMDAYDARENEWKDENEERDATISFRWVCDGKNYYTYIFAEKRWTKRRMCCAMYGEMGWYYNDIKLDKESEKIVETFVKGAEVKDFYNCTLVRADAIRKLQGLEGDIRDEKKEKRKSQRRARIDARVAKRKSLPKDWNRWVKTNVFKNERYLFYDAKKRKQGICAYCGKVVDLDGKQKHNAYGKCKACGSKIQYKAKGKVPRVINRKQAIYLQKTEDGFLARYVIVTKISSPEGEEYRSHEVALATYDGKKIWYDYCMVSEFSGKEYWTDAKTLDMNGWSTEGYLYTRNAKQVLKNTKFQYAPVVEWMKHEKKEIPLGDFLMKYKHSPFLEFFIKVRLYRLTKDYIRMYGKWEGKNPKEILGINKQRIKRLIQIDGGICALEWLRYEEQQNIKISQQVIMWLQSNCITVKNCKSILEEIRSIDRMVNYIKKQKGEPFELVITWRDYLRMAKREGMDIADSIVRFPKNLQARHDQLVAMSEEKAEERRITDYSKAFDEQIQERLPGVTRYFWENEEYMIIPAGKCEELVIEGRTLHHCVGRDAFYMRRMAEGASWILFLRKKENLEQAYYTIEIDVQSDEILQCYSEFDRKPDWDVIEKILNKFKQSIKQKRKKQKGKVA